jgi:hypothetical protein
MKMGSSDSKVIESEIIYKKTINFSKTLTISKDNLSTNEVSIKIGFVEEKSEIKLFRK